jgi:glycine hydroxymethyltransferase
MDKILQLIKKEEKRQQETLMMIPSENYTYPEVRQAVGSVLMHKYSEGQPGKRYYQGNSIIDEIELLTKINALELFKLTPDKWQVNVQALSGAQANLAVYNALLDPGDKILSLYLPDGGHLSHGWHIKPKEGLPAGRQVTLVSKIYDVGFYHVDPESYLIDYDLLAQQANRMKPKIIVSGGTAYPREINHKKIADIAHKVGAYYLADVSHEAGLIAGGANTSPFPYADIVMMTTHKTLRGPRGALIFSRADLSAKVDSSVFPGIQGGPHNETIAGIGIALGKANTNKFKIYAKQVVTNAQSLAKKLIDLKIPVITGGTDKHLILIDLRPLEVNAAAAANALETAGIIVNKNTVPYDTASPMNPSGIRLGTPAITARGMKRKEMETIADWIAEIIVNPDSAQKIAKDVKALTGKFPLP